jgi:Na+:H+ antiporter, NhaA family
MRTATAVARHPRGVHVPRARWFEHFAFEYLLALPAGVVIAQLWATLDPERYFALAYAAAFAVNDIAMVCFFALMTKEIAEATAPGGLFHPWRRIALPVACAAGGIAASAMIYGPFARALGTPMLQAGWPVVFAMDLALVYFVGRLIFGRHPAVPFLLIMAIAANGLGFVALALLYPARPPHLLAAFAFLTAALLWALALRLWRVRSFWPYVGIAGTMAWAGLYVGGFHPAFALVPIVACMPHAKRDPGFFVDAPPARAIRSTGSKSGAVRPRK